MEGDRRLSRPHDRSRRTCALLSSCNGGKVQRSLVQCVIVRAYAPESCQRGTGCPVCVSCSTPPRNLISWARPTKLRFLGLTRWWHVRQRRSTAAPAYYAGLRGRIRLAEGFIRENGDRRVPISPGRQASAAYDNAECNLRLHSRLT